ncbi:MAG: flagellar biosynthetic protein FliO [Thiotrichales bacterium]|nr:flagellar biosynthetic protein FliO [Thiotrichales bacterium]MBT3612972.1 flagellar biosynthetic protein FliO [Thiotrichales bacterium]MBT4262352.1 flagellar biosynthetic protein FliO [Thiotrichales bacterium]MBT4971433.1 flagellar biosynthetic protein FliO [Thiotrichales bacterium]MBT5291298.1 flagellar biosynthetic protein FliO [Thiotrichales bacterium]
MNSTSPKIELISEPLGMAQLFQTFFSLLIVILLIIGIAWLMRRSGRFGSALDGQLRAVGGLSLGSRERILLVDAGGTHILIGVSPGGGIQTLYVFPEPLKLDSELLSNSNSSKAFTAILQKFTAQRDGDSVKEDKVN